MSPTGLQRVLAFNWPSYVAALVLVVVASWLGMVLNEPWRWLCLAGAAIAAWLALASVIATWWAYDASGVYQWRWLAETMPKPRRWCLIHVGLDDAGPRLVELLGGEHRCFDVHRASTSAPSLERARAGGVAAGEAVGADPLPLPDAWADAVFVLFAAHEVRDDAERAALFRELRRVLAPGAALHVVEHLRDPANVLAYGPGAWHFLTRGTWLRTFTAAALTVTSERRVTPFLRWFVLGSREA